MTNKAVYRAFYGLAVVLLVFHGAVFSGFTIDDAYITFTYTKNLVQGFGPVFAPHEHVEATSSMLWAVLLIPFEAATAHGAVTGSKILGIFLALCTLAAGSFLVRRLLGPDQDAFHPCLWFALALAGASPFVVWSAYGIENPLVAFLLVLSVLLFLKDVNQGSSGSAFAVFLLQTARPEGFIYIAVFAAMRLGLALVSDQDNPKKPCIKWFAILGACLFVYEAAGFLFYGHLLPNTVQAKVDGLSISRLRQGLAYVIYDGARVYSFLLFAAAQLALFLWAMNFPKTKRELSGFLRREAGLLLILCLLGIHWLFVIFVGGDWMRHARFLAHFIPMLLVLLIVCAWRAFQPGSSAHASPRLTRAVCLVFINAFFFFWIFNIQASYKIHQYQTGLQASEERALTGMAVLLNKLAKTNNTVAACSDVGRLAYFFKGRILDGGWRTRRSPPWASPGAG